MELQPIGHLINFHLLTQKSIHQVLLLFQSISNKQISLYKNVRVKYKNVKVKYKKRMYF